MPKPAHLAAVVELYLNRDWKEPGGLVPRSAYHVMARGDRRERIVHDEIDRYSLIRDRSDKTRRHRSALTYDIRVERQGLLKPIGILRDANRMG